MSQYFCLPGKPLPYGATVMDGGVQFSVFSRHASSISLLIYEEPDHLTTPIELPFDGRRNKTGDIWHMFVGGLKAGSFYLFRVDGPDKPETGHRFNSQVLLLDPYSKAVTENGFSVIVNDEFDWQDDRPLNYPLRHSIIYETHVRGLTMHPSSRVSHPGTYRGVIEKIPYLKDLGITSIEFLPVMEFDEHENLHINPLTKETLTNYWGYSTISFFAPEGRYSSKGDKGEQVSDFKEMVRELHKAGIEVILDIVFNHTAEMDENGPTYNFRGFDNSIYYILEEDKRYYKDFTGCRNTFNCNHPTVRSFILDCLHYWVIEMHVDGFRFDLGSVLGRDQNGNLLENPPILERIAEDPVLRHTKIIAEAWDAAGAYQVGWFPGGRWAEWNDKFRDDLRRFWQKTGEPASQIATRLTGSSDLYLRDGRKPFHSINFLTSHDGFTLYDLVSYKMKHNIINGEDQRDGTDYNLSLNFGIEGPTKDPQILSLRYRQLKNYLTLLFLSIGTPMLLGGDEFGRTQRGNNNAYCQDNDISWFDWNLLSENSGIFRFTKMLISFRQSHPVFHRPEFYNGFDSDHNTIPDISWFNSLGEPVVWEKSKGFIAFLIDGGKAEIEADRDDNDFYFIVSNLAEERKVRIAPAISGKKWFKVIDTSLDSPDDFTEKGSEIVISPKEEILVQPGTVCLLLAR